MQSRSAAAIPPITHGEELAKKGIGALEAGLMSLGFTTSNLVHIINPVAEGGLGVAVASLGVAITCIVLTGVLSILIAFLISRSVIHVIRQDEKEMKALLQEQNQLEEKQQLLLARLLYVWHLSKLAEKRQSAEQKELTAPPPALKTQMQNNIQAWLGLEEKPAIVLTNKLDEIYTLAGEGIEEAIRSDHETSEELIIRDYLSRNEEKLSLNTNEIFTEFYPPRRSKKSWSPEIAGFFAGFVSFMSMSSGFLGTYSSILTIAAGIGAVNLAIPVLGWAILGLSIVFALCIGLLVRHYTGKRASRQVEISHTQAREKKITDALVNIHDPEISMLNRRIHEAEIKVVTETKRADRAEEKVRTILREKIAAKPALPRVSTWPHSLFSLRNRQEQVILEDKPTENRMAKPQ